MLMGQILLIKFYRLSLNPKDFANKDFLRQSRIFMKKAQIVTSKINTTKTKGRLIWGISASNLNNKKDYPHTPIK